MLGPRGPHPPCCGHQRGREAVEVEVEVEVATTTHHLSRASARCVVVASSGVDLAAHIARFTLVTTQRGTTAVGGRRRRRRRACWRYVGEGDGASTPAAPDAPRLTPLASMLRRVRHEGGRQEEVEEIRRPAAIEETLTLKKRRCSVRGSDIAAPHRHLFIEGDDWQ